MTHENGWRQDKRKEKLRAPSLHPPPPQSEENWPTSTGKYIMCKLDKKVLKFYTLSDACIMDSSCTLVLLKSSAQ
jgi:hypothetical protein